MDWKDKLQSLMPQDYTPSEPTEAEATHAAAAPKEKLLVAMERKGRGGKTATIISGFTVDDDAVEELAALLKKKLGTGGSARGGEILIQGDRRTEVVKLLRSMGYKTKNVP